MRNAEKEKGKRKPRIDAKSSYKETSTPSKKAPDSPASYASSDNESARDLKRRIALISKDNTSRPKHTPLAIDEDAFAKDQDLDTVQREFLINLGERNTCDFPESVNGASKSSFKSASSRRGPSPIPLDEDELRGVGAESNHAGSCRQSPRHTASADIADDNEKDVDKDTYERNDDFDDGDGDLQPQTQESYASTPSSHARDAHASAPHANAVKVNANDCSKSSIEEEEAEDADVHEQEQIVAPQPSSGIKRKHSASVSDEAEKDRDHKLSRQDDNAAPQDVKLQATNDPEQVAKRSKEDTPEDKVAAARLAEQPEGLHVPDKLATNSDHGVNNLKGSADFETASEEDQVDTMEVDEKGSSREVFRGEDVLADAMSSEQVESAQSHAEANEGEQNSHDASKDLETAVQQETQLDEDEDEDEAEDRGKTDINTEITESVTCNEKCGPGENPMVDVSDDNVVQSRVDAEHEDKTPSTSSEKKSPATIRDDGSQAVADTNIADLTPVKSSLTPVAPQHHPPPPQQQQRQQQQQQQQQQQRQEPPRAPLRELQTTGRMQIQTEKTKKPSTANPNEEAFWARMALVKERVQVDYTDGLQGIGLETEQRELRALVQAAVENGESSSAIIVGEQGAGKSFLVNKVLHDVASEGHRFLRVSLDGDLQVDDVSALKEITRQLCLGGSRATWKRGTFSQHLRFLLSVLFEGAHSGQHGVPLIFVLDHFEAFAQRRKQTLLYNLLDLTQSRDARIVVIGCTHRIDVVEQMEKRIKSRFDNRQIFIAPPSADTVQNILLERLLLPGPAHAAWNSKVHDLLGVHDKEVPRGVQELRRLSQLGFGIGWFLRFVDVALSRLRMRHRRGARHLEGLVVSDLRDAASSLQTDVRERVVFSLSTVEILLLASVIQMEKVQERRAFNFELTFAQASKYYRVESNRERPLSRAVARKAFEHLVELGILRPAQEVGAGQGRSAGPAHRLHRLMIDPELFLDSLRQNKIKCQSQLQQWALSRCTT
ncbi:Origin recognition complex subunit 4 [Hondaea fermentalgiana]|uniref:Origin recognition complex subunit 4 n=1 Tax=Hondaea fermentalgiana TaxID=2315210 RepID=A0A2R5H1K7_9STRA|nr:Origin recognition complex subunit 4 [Hondaea fermentalgiana]|eukprot:GBG34691.1 Origin recognition complex subunit 4 [Hondaea fermentalgiana]